MSLHSAALILSNYPQTWLSFKLQHQFQGTTLMAKPFTRLFLNMHTDYPYSLTPCYASTLTNKGYRTLDELQYSIWKHIRAFFQKNNTDYLLMQRKVVHVYKSTRHTGIAHIIRLFAGICHQSTSYHRTMPTELPFQTVSHRRNAKRPRPQDEELVSYGCFPFLPFSFQLLQTFYFWKYKVSYHVV